MTDATRNDQVADLIAQRRKARRRDLVRSTSDEPAPLSSVQLSLWTVAAVDPSPSAANRPCALRIRGPLDHHTLATALNGLIARHEPLRTVYPLVGEEPIQRVLAPFSVDIEAVDASQLGSADRAVRLSQVLENARSQRFDLATEVAFRAVLVSEAPNSHVLVLSLSHLAFDGWSEEVLRADLTELYRAAFEGVEPDLPLLDICYSDYARWQRKDQGSRSSGPEYWATSLAGLGHAPPLPQGDRSSSPEGNSCSARLDADKLAAVVERARSEHTTTFVVLLAALELLGRELMDAEDFVVSCPVAGRDQPEVQNLVGCFINPIFVRSSVGRVQTNGELLRAVRSEVLAGLANSSTPSRDVLEPWSASGRLPLLHRLSLQWRDFPGRQPVGAAPIDVDVVPIAGPSPVVSWRAAPHNDGASITVEFDAELVGSSTVAGWIERFRELIAVVCGAPDEPLPERQTDHRAPDPCAPLVPEILEPVIVSVHRQVRMSPGAVAVVCDDVEVSYAELWRRSGAAAGQLMEQGVQPGDPVVVLTTLNAGHVVAMLAVLRAGAVAVPVDAGLPLGQRSSMIHVACARHAVLVDHSTAMDPAVVPHVVHLDRLGQALEHHDTALDQVRVGALDDRAYIMFTSGTTGTPKAIVGTHQGLGHFVSWQRARLGVRPGDVVAGITGPSFDVSLRELFLPLTSGATLSIAPRGLRVDGGIDWLHRCGASVLHITPSLAAAWLAEDKRGRDDAESGSSDLRWTVFAGEPLAADIVERWRERLSSSVRILNLYGPTETCMAKASHEVVSPRPGVQPVGGPLPSTQLLVVAVNEARLCSPGESGEVVIRTAIGTQGYLHDDEDGFVANPFAPESGEVVYRTGDVGWYEPDWSVTVRGRLDDQVKIDGVRVEPGEAASYLAGHPNVSQCVVLPVDDNGTTRLEAFFVPEGEAPLARELRTYLHQSLRAAAIPSAFHVVSRIPLTPNHKTDRQALLDEDDDTDSGEVPPSRRRDEAVPAPGTPVTMDALIAASWGDVLDRPSVDRSTDFFAAGGTSLRAQRILAQLETKTGVTAPIELFFDHPTLGEFVQAFSRVGNADNPLAPRSAGSNESPGLAPAVVPLSFAQQRLWVVEQMAPGLGQYVVPICRHVRGPLDIEALEQAFTQLVARHDVLRSRVVAEHGEPRLIIGDPEWVGVEQHDLRFTPMADRAALVERLVFEAAETPFDLANDLPLRVRAIQVGPDEWVLAIAMHHIVIDGLSYPVLFGELAAFYRSALDSVPAGLEPLEAQYTDFAAWQHDRAAAHSFDRQLDYWSSALSGPVPAGPSGSPEPGGDPEAPIWARRALPADFQDKLTRLAGRLRVSPHMLVLALVSGVVCDETDEDEMATAIVFADRSWPLAEHLIGYFINTLPLRIPAPRGASLAETAAGVRQVTLDAYQNGDVPLDLILQRLRLDRQTVDRLINSIDVDLSEEDLTTTQLELSGTTSTVYDLETTFLKFDLQLSLSTFDGAMTLKVKGRASLYSQADLDRLADRFVQLSAQCLDDPTLPVRRSSPTSGDSSESIELVPHRLGRLAHEGPRQPAVVDRDQVWTRAQLVEQSASIGAFLVSRGVQPGDRVVLAASRSATAVAAMYGIWSAGAAYVPIDPAHQSGRTHSIVAQCEPSLVLTDDPTLAADAPVALLSAAVTHPVGADRLPGASPESPAYVIYTSGSTGRPKGVVVPHRAVAAFVDGASQAYGIATGDTVLQFHSFAFDASVEELHLPLAVGAEVVLRSEDLLGSARRFVAYIQTHSISVVSLPTAFWHELTHQLVAEQIALPECLSIVIIGGEVAQPDIVAAWHALGSKVALINSYGPTETTVAVAGAVLQPGNDGELVSVGHPFGAASFLVVDGDNHEVGPAEWGELLISGPQLASGYFGLPEATAEVFVHRTDGRRWYRTGDRARRRGDGRFEVSGRFDQQLKIDGHRVEPAEIEAALRALDDVVEGIVVPSTSGGVVDLHAFVTGRDVETVSVRSRLAEQLPPQMVPSQIHQLEALPVGVGGKVDREALRALVDEPVVEAVADVGDSLGQMVAIWAELLGVDGVHAGSDFFELGGRSLTAVRLAYLIESEFGVSLPVAAVFDAPTVGALSAAVDARLGVEPAAQAHVPAADTPAAIAPLPAEVNLTVEASSSPVEAISRVTPSSRPWLDEPVRLHLDLAPLALAQQRIWLHQQLRTGTLGYRIPVRYRLRGPLDVDALRRSLDRLVARHEVLRTRIVVVDGRPLQRITPVSAPAPDLVTFVDKADSDPLERPDLADAAVHEWIETPFDLESEHPFDVLLLRLAPREHQLVLRFHHIAVDAESISLIEADLSQLYAAATGHAEPPPEPPVQFADYAVWQRARVAAGLHDEAAAYWRGLIGHSPRAIDLPGRLPDARPGGTPAFHDVDLPQTTARALLELAERNGISNFQLLVALTAATVHRLTGSEKVTLGAPNSERLPGASDSIVGLLVNTMVVPTEVSDDTSFVGLLVQVRTMVGRSIDRGGLPFDLLLEELNVPRDPHRLPLISAMCSMHEAGGSETIHLPGVDVEKLASGGGDGAIVADLMVAGVISAAGELTFDLRHDDAVLEPWVVAEMARSFAQLAIAAAADPDRPIAELPVLDPDEGRWLAQSLNQNEAAFPGDTRVEQSVADIAASQPDAAAVVDATGALTYGELVDEARELAGRLRDNGVEPGNTVAIALDRSVSLAVAMLATLQAEAVYVPIDGAAPPQRQDDILQMAGVRALITASSDGQLLVQRRNHEPVALPQRDGEVPAYVMYTSGSTGVPKGAVISHRAIQRTVQHVDYAPLGAGEVVAMASNPAFDALTFEIWGALLNGARLEVFDTDTLGDPEEFAHQLAERSVTTMFLTTSLVNMINQAVPGAFACLDTLIVGGEAVNVATMRELVRHGPRRVVNGYGPTECTTFSVWHLVEEVAEDAWTVPIGGPTRNTSVHVVDERGALVPRGIPGELSIAGPGLALGYLGDEQLTRERFVDLSMDGETVRAYRTGDVVRRRLDGAIEYLGRRDHQVKLRGFRIELGGIETALLRGDDVGAAVVRLTGEGAHRHLVAYVAPAKHALLDETALRSRMADQVPSYMLPSHYVMLDALPLNKSGKVDRLALPEPGPGLVATVETNEGLTDIEAAVVEFWSQVLDGEAIGPDDDFFDHGGNSLLGVEALAAAESHFGLHFRLSTLFEARTPRAFAAMIAAEQQQTSASEAGVADFVTLQGGDPSQTPLWLIHPAGGSLVLYEPLARHLPSHRRIVGVEASGLDSESQPLDSVPALADHQLATILQLQPQGPYRLLGYSIGGIVGLELARRLQARGEIVEFLGAIEAGVPSGPTELPSRRDKYSALLRRRDFKGIGSSLLTSLRNRRSELEVRVAAGRSDLDRAHKRVLDSMVHAFHQFVPSGLDISMTLFYGEGSSDASVEQLRDRWGELASQGVVVRRVSGSHGNDLVLRDPHAKVLASAVEEALSMCDQGRHRDH